MDTKECRCGDIKTIWRRLSVFSICFEGVLRARCIRKDTTWPQGPTGKYITLYYVYVYVHAEPTNCENWQADQSIYRSKRSLKRCQDFSRSPGRKDQQPPPYLCSRPRANWSREDRQHVRTCRTWFKDLRAQRTI